MRTLVRTASAVLDEFASSFVTHRYSRILQVHAMLDEVESTRHHYDPDAVKKVQQHARAARIATADRHTNFNSCAIEAQTHLVCACVILCIAAVEAQTPLVCA